MWAHIIETVTMCLYLSYLATLVIWKHFAAARLWRESWEIIATCVTAWTVCVTDDSVRGMSKDFPTLGRIGISKISHEWSSTFLLFYGCHIKAGTAQLCMCRSIPADLVILSKFSSYTRFSCFIIRPPYPSYLLWQLLCPGFSSPLGSETLPSDTDSSLPPSHGSVQIKHTSRSI